MPELEQNFYALWAARQASRGAAAAAAAMRRLRQIGGDFAIQRADGNEAYSDLSKYPANADWIDSLLGSGEPVIHGTPAETAFLYWLLHGAETVVANAAQVGPPAVPASNTHQFRPSLTRPHWATFQKRVGNIVSTRHLYADSLVTRIVMECSTANKAMRLTSRVLSLDPAAVQAADPAAALPAKRMFLYTDGRGEFRIDGTVFRGQTQFTFTIDEALEADYGDDTKPFEIVQGTPSVTIGATIKLDADAMALWNKLIYGAAAPAAGAKPLDRVPSLGTYSAKLTQAEVATTETNRIDLTIPQVKWAPPELPGGNIAGGSSELVLAGAVRNPAAGGAAYALDVTIPDGAFA